ncbi:MAG: hypothetical protein IKS00_02320 [Bacteroidales bacterium]|nr:hypothetical protein [Bacteroidales bacterium]
MEQSRTKNITDNFPDFGPHTIEEAFWSVAEAEKQFAENECFSNEDVLKKMKAKYCVL